MPEQVSPGPITAAPEPAPEPAPPAPLLQNALARAEYSARLEDLSGVLTNDTDSLLRVTRVHDILLPLQGKPASGAIGHSS